MFSFITQVMAFMKTIELNVEEPDFSKRLAKALKEVHQQELVHLLLIISQPTNQLYKGAILGILFAQLKSCRQPVKNHFNLLLSNLAKNLSETELRAEVKAHVNLDWEWKLAEKTGQDEKTEWKHTFSQNIEQAFGEDEPDYSKVPLKEHNPDFKPWKKDQSMSPDSTER